MWGRILDLLLLRRFCTLELMFWGLYVCVLLLPISESLLVSLAVKVGIVVLFLLISFLSGFWEAHRRRPGDLDD